MIRTQIYLPLDVYTQIKLDSQKQGKPAAVMIRKYIVSGLKKSKKITAREAFLNIAKHASFKGPSDLSTNLDNYLYGDS